MTKKHMGYKFKVHFSKNIFVLPGDFYCYLARLKNYGGLKNVNLNFKHIFVHGVHLNIKGKMGVVSYIQNK